MSKSSYKEIIGGITFYDDYLTKENELFSKKIYYNEIKEYYIKKTLHAKYTTKDLVLVTTNNKNMKISYAVGSVFLFIDDPEERILSMLKKVCPNAKHIQRNFLKNLVKEMK